MLCSILTMLSLAGTIWAAVEGNQPATLLGVLSAYGWISAAFLYAHITDTSES